MDRTIVDRAILALAALNRETQSAGSPLPSLPNRPDESAGCGSPHCSGCYEVDSGLRLHPPRCGKDYKM
jgi:hypothetical protein